jgi:ABC-type nitrate/sulfonate/bicarbonate transport system substrate-binding protein
MYSSVAIVALVVLASILGFQYLRTPPSAVNGITLGFVDVTNAHWPIYIAEDVGIFHKYGLNVTTVTLGSGRNLATALVAGQIEIASVTLTTLVPAKLEGLDVVQVAATEKTRPLYLVTRQEIRSVEQLKGKIGGVVNVGSGLIYVATVTMLRQLGLDPTRDVTLVGISGSAAVRFAAVQSGKIDFTVDSDFSRAKKLGLNVLLYLPDVIKALPGNGCATTSNYLREDRETVKQFIRALTEATRFFFENKDESKRILGKWLQENDPESLEQHYQDWSRVALKIPETSIDQVTSILEALAPFTPKAANADPSIFVDNSLVKELENEGFFKRIWE